jgi:hypothetical protein
MKQPVKTTSKYSVKKYKCCKCGNVSNHGTNHYGHIYPPCKQCGHIEHECMEPVPDGMGVPERWTLVKLGDICDIRTIRL